MCQMISCLVTRNGRVLAQDGVHSHTQLAKNFKVNEDKVLKYEFRLKDRQLFQDFDMDTAPFEAKSSHDQAAQNFFNQCAGTPEKLIAYVQKGNFNENVLLGLLTPAAMKAYNKAKAAARKAYNKAIIAAARKTYNKVTAAAEKAYNKALAAAEKAYNKAMAPVWINLFKDEKNRIESWV